MGGGGLARGPTHGGHAPQREKIEGRLVRRDVWRSVVFFAVMRRARERSEKSGVLTFCHLIFVLVLEEINIAVR